MSTKQISSNFIKKPLFEPPRKSPIKIYNQNNIQEQFSLMTRDNDGTLRPLPKETINLLEELKKASIEGNKK